MTEWSFVSGGRSAIVLLDPNRAAVLGELCDDLATLRAERPFFGLL